LKLSTPLTVLSIHPTPYSPLPFLDDRHTKDADPAGFAPQGLGRSPEWVWATTNQPLAAGGDRETYLWGNLRARQEGYRFSPAPGSHNSANLVNLAGSNALAVVPTSTTQVAAESLVQVMVVGRVTV
jgi:hypothetical protein